MEGQENAGFQKEIDTWKLINRIDEIQQQNNEKFDNLKSELTEIKEVMNNGIIKQTEENTQVVNEVKKYINTKEGASFGKKQVTHIIIGIASGLGSGIIGILTILKFLGAI